MREALDKLRICFIAGTLGQGGAERQLYYILQTLRNNGTRVSLLCLTRGEFWEGPIRALGVPVLWIGQTHSRLARLARICKEVRKLKPDVLQSAHFYTNLYAVMAGRLCNSADVGALRGDVFLEFETNGRLLGNLNLRWPRHLAVNSLNGLRNALSHGACPKRCRILPNVVDTAYFQPGCAKPRDGVVLLAAGRLAPEKRLDRFLDLIARLRETSALPIRGIIVGDGPLRQSLEERARCLKLTPDLLEFRGAAAEMIQAYREADIFVLTSESEGTPNVLLEASAAELPIVSTRVGGVSDVVRHGATGFVCDRGNDEMLASAVLRLADNEVLRRQIGKQGRHFVEQEHSLARLFDFLTDFYFQVLGRLCKPIIASRLSSLNA